MSFLQIPTLLLVASAIWIIRCSYNVATTIKSMMRDWSENEANAQLILIPIFEVLIAAAVLAIVTTVIFKPVWTDASLQPSNSYTAPVPIGQYPQQGSTYPQPDPMYPQPPTQYPYSQPPPQAPAYYSDAPQQQQQPHVYTK